MLDDVYLIYLLSRNVGSKSIKQQMPSNDVPTLKGDSKPS